MIRYPIALVGTLAACFAVQSLALRLNGGSTVKSESNYFSSIARIQTESQKNASILFLGSSLTGRLADRGGDHPGVANLGCDGGHAAITLRAMDRRLLPAAPLLIIETNTLGYALENRGRDIAEALDSRWFALGSEVKNFGATARPSAFCYSWLMARRFSDAPATAETLGLGSLPAPLPPGSGPALTAAENALVEELTAILSRLRERGSRILLVQFPAGDLADPVLAHLPTALAARSGLPYWDLNAGLAPETVAYTDGRHLDGPSARKLMNTLLASRVRDALSLDTDR